MPGDEEMLSLPKRFVNRVGNPLEWGYVDKALVLMGLSLSLNLFLNLFLIFAHYLPDFYPKFFDRSLFTIGFRLQLLFLLIYVTLFIVGFIIRRRHPGSHWFAYAFALTFSAHDAWLIAVIGHSTNPATFLVLFLGVFIGLLFFDFTFSLCVIFSWVLILGFQIIGEHLGLVSYAPALVDSPFKDGRIDLWWMYCTFSVCLVLTATMLGIFAYVIFRWRKREAQVTELSELLKKMFGRYLSTEVMNTLIENPSALELGGERRKVTIMMTDLRGFTALSESLEPERVVQMLNSYFEVMVDVVLEYNGTINEIIGDALLIIFGAPQEMSDRNQQAIACAIEMQNAMAEVNKENRAQGLPELEMGIGLNETEVIVGNIGSTKRSKYTVVGSGVNMTSRIESYTVGGQILISDSVYKDAGDDLRIDGQREVLPKGAETPLRIYEVGGIAGRYNLALEGKDPAMVTLARKIPAHYTVLEGKHIGKKGLTGTIAQLSEKRAVIGLDEMLEPLTNLKMNLAEVTHKLGVKDFYGKVIERSDRKHPIYVIRFTSVPPEVDAYFQAHIQYSIKESNE